MSNLDQKSVDESPATSQPIVELRNISKSYGEVQVLDNVSFKLLRGETKIILGGGGSGKSTMLKLMMGLEKPDDGRILIEGLDITDMNESMLNQVRPKIGMVFQEAGLFDSMSVFENVAYKLFELPMNEKLIEERVKKVLGFVGLADATEMLPSEVSGGMRRRVALARALITEPAIMLYDEPTAGLDPVTSRKINELIIRLRDIQDVSGVFVTHRLRDAFTLATEYAKKSDDGVKFIREDGTFCLAHTRFVMLNAGKIVFEGPDEALRKSTDPYIKRFLS